MHATTQMRTFLGGFVELIIFRMIKFVIYGLPQWLSMLRGSAGDYQADEQAGVTRLRWRLLGR